MCNDLTPKISVICVTYNHEKYIRRALESIVMQKTKFNFEIIVHDDASTDNTADIIREYELMYPNIITTIIQKENKYSKGINFQEQYVFPIVHGKYIAICEGDDYWIDPYKLQKQYDVLESHTDIDMCAHGAYVTYFDSNKKCSLISPAKEDRIFYAEDVIRGGGGFVATASLLYRSELNRPIPLFRKTFDIDYMLQIQGSLRGGMYYIKDSMSVYRKGASGSWSEAFTKNSNNFRVDFNNKVILALNELDKYSNGKYTKVIKDKVLRMQLENACYCREYDKLKNGELKDFYGHLSSSDKLKIILKKYCPFLDNIGYKIKKLVYKKHGV